MQKQQIEFDVVVIGAGPAGLMAALAAAKNGARVALVEKNDRPAIKLLMSGNGRCNVTQDAQDLVEFSKKFRNGKFLLSAFHAFSPDDLRQFLLENSVPTKVEKNGKVFPVSDKASEVLEVFEKLLKENGVNFFYNSAVSELILEQGKISKIILKKREISGKKFILAVGGKSYPASGSSGDGYAWAQELGHAIILPRPLLVPVMIAENWVKDLQGASAHSVGLQLWKNERKITEQKGDLMFAHYGLSGPLALNLSREISEALEKSENDQLKLILDLRPELSLEKIDEIIRKDFEKNAGKNLSNCLLDFCPPKIREKLLQLSGLDLEKHAGKISRQERQKIAQLFKHLEMTPSGLFGFEKAMVTRGGIEISQINSATMQSKIVPNLYFAGEIMDVDGPTGGYNLQICWSTGNLAGLQASR